MVQPLIRENLPGRGIDAIHLLPTRMKITAYNQHNGSFPPSSWSLCKVTTVYRALGAVVLIQSRAAATFVRDLENLLLLRGGPAFVAGLPTADPPRRTANPRNLNRFVAARAMTVHFGSADWENDPRQNATGGAGRFANRQTIVSRFGIYSSAP